MSPETALFLLSARIGDVIFCTPALELLHRQRPEIAIDAVVLSEGSAEVLAFNPAVRRVYLARDHPLAELHPRYDAVIAPQDSRAVRDYAGTHAVEIFSHVEGRHQSDAITLSVARHFGCAAEVDAPYRLYPQPEHHRRGAELLADQGASAVHRLVGMHLGCRRVAQRGQAPLLKRMRRHFLPGKTAKAMPPALAVALVDRLREKLPDLVFVLTGSSTERMLARHFRRREGVIDVIGRTDVLELAALMRRLDLFVSGDTGPLHVACAMDTPLVTLHSSTRPGDTGARPAAPHRVALQGNPIESIPVAKIAEHVSHFLREGAPPCKPTRSEPGPDASAISLSSVG